MRYIMIGILIGILAAYAVEAVFPFKPAWGAAAMVVFIVIGVIIQCRANKKCAPDENQEP